MSKILVFISLFLILSSKKELNLTWVVNDFLRTGSLNLSFPKEGLHVCEIPGNVASKMELSKKTIPNDTLYKIGQKQTISIQAQKQNKEKQKVDVDGEYVLTSWRVFDCVSKKDIAEQLWPKIFELVRQVRGSGISDEYLNQLKLSKFSNILDEFIFHHVLLNDERVPVVSVNIDRGYFTLDDKIKVYKGTTKIVGPATVQEGEVVMRFMKDNDTSGGTWYIEDSGEFESCGEGKARGIDILKNKNTGGDRPFTTLGSIFTATFRYNFDIIYGSPSVYHKTKITSVSICIDIPVTFVAPFLT